MIFLFRDISYYEHFAINMYSNNNKFIIAFLVVNLFQKRTSCAFSKKTSIIYASSKDCSIT